MNKRIIYLILFFLLLTSSAFSRIDESYFISDNPISIKLGTIPNPIDIEEAKVIFGEPDAIGAESYGIYGKQFFEWYVNNYIFHVTNVYQSLYLRNKGGSKLTLFADVILGEDSAQSVMKKMENFYKIKPNKKLFSSKENIQTLFYAIAVNNSVIWIVFEFSNYLYKISLFNINPEDIGYSGIGRKIFYNRD